MILQLSLLGGFRAQVKGTSLALPKKAQGLLAYLALAAGEPQSRAKLAGLLWGDSGEEQARNSLRQVLFVIRGALGPGVGEALALEQETVALVPGAARVDIDIFRLLVAEHTRASLERALDLYRGDLLDGHHLREAAFESWLMAERERLRQLALRGFSELFDWQRRDGATDAAMRTALKLLDLDPLQESVHRGLMRLYVDQGNRAAALKQYESCAQMLRRDLGVQPEAETKVLYRELLEHRVTGARSAGPEHAVGRSAATDAADVGTVALIGRDVEVSRALEEVTRSRKGTCRVVAVVGEAGVGKTRLLDEVAAEARHEGMALARGHAHPSERMLPYGLWLSALRDAGAVARPTLLEGLAPMWQQELSRLFPEMRRQGRLLTVGSENSVRIHEAIAQLLGRLAAHQPVLILLEDVHWADPTSLRLLAFVARRLENHPICFAVSARLDEAGDQSVLQSVLDELEREKRLAQVTLEPLSRENTLSLIRVLVAPLARAGVARLGEHVWQLSEGNPFVIREAVRAFQENPQSSITDSAPTPELIGRMVLERLERLGSVARALCAAAAVLGKAVRLALLRRTAGVDEREAVDGVEELVRSGVLRVVGEDLGFTHDRIREVGYTSLEVERRRLLHVEAAVAIEQLCADDLEPHLAALAEHWREAEEWDKAVHYRRRAADQALTRAAYVEAGRLLEETLDLVTHLPEGSGRSDVELDVLLRLRVLTKLVGEGEHLGRHLDEAERLARALGDARRLAFVLSERSHIAWLRGDQVRATEIGQQVEALGQELGDRPIEGFGHRLVGKSYLGRGLCEVAAEHLTRAVELLPDDGQPDFGLGDARSGTQIWLAIALAVVGRFDEATRILDEVMAVAAGQNNHRQLAWATTFAAMVRVERGEVAEAFGLLERAGHLISTWQIAAVAPWRAQVLGRACALAGRQAEALRIFDRFEPRPQLFGSWIALLKGDAYLAAELLDNALAMARTALDIARRLGERGSEAPALRLLGDAHARLGAPDDETAAAYFREGIAVSEETGNRPQMARCHLGLGLLLRRAGRHDEAFLHLAAARRMLSEMGMTYWLARIPDGVA